MGIFFSFLGYTEENGPSTLNPLDGHAHRIHFLWIDAAVLVLLMLWSHLCDSFSASRKPPFASFLPLSFARKCWYSSDAGTFGVDVNSINLLLTTCFAFFPSSGEKWFFFSSFVVVCFSRVCVCVGGTRCHFETNAESYVRWIKMIVRNFFPLSVCCCDEINT